MTSNIAHQIFLILSALIVNHSVLAQNFNVNPYSPSAECNAGYSMHPSGGVDYSVSWYTSTLIVPGVILGLGLLALVIFQLTLCCSCCMKTCCPNSIACCFSFKEYEIDDYQERKKRHKRAIYAFFIALLSAFITICMMFVARNDVYSVLTGTSNTLTASSVFLKSILVILAVVLSDVQTMTDVLTDTTSPCYQATTSGSINIQAQLVSTAASVHNAINSIFNVIDSLPNLINSVSLHIS